MNSKEARISTELLTYVNWIKNMAVLLIASFYILFDPWWAGADTAFVWTESAMLLGMFVKGARVGRMRETAMR